MAKTTIVKLTDDLDGSDAAGTVIFGWSGQQYEIDLSKRNATAFEKLVRPYIEAGRKSTGTRAGRKVAKKATEDLGAVRAWARSNGYSVSDRGRVPTTIIDAYKAR